jgi:hypothetical protein
MIIFDVSKHTKPHSPVLQSDAEPENGYYCYVGSLSQHSHLLAGAGITLRHAVSRNDRFLHASFPSLIQTFRLPATTYINFLSLPILHFLPRPLFLYSDSYTSKAKAATQYNHSESVTSINSPVSFQNKTKMADIHVYAWNR